MNEQQVSEESSELRNIIEAALFVAEEPVTVRKIRALFPTDAQPSPEQIHDALSSLELEFEERGIQLTRVGKGYRFQSREKYAPWLRKLNEGRPPRYSRALLETLAIIAYRQPVTRGDIEEIRGVTVSTDIMRTLQDRGWIKELGHRDVPGHPALFGTTHEFLEYFNLRSLSELPPLKEQRSPEDIARELNLRLPVHTGGSQGDAAGADGEQVGEPRPRQSAEIIHLDTAGATHSEPALDVDGEREAT